MTDQGILVVTLILLEEDILLHQEGDEGLGRHEEILVRHQEGEETHVPQEGILVLHHDDEILHQDHMAILQAKVQDHQVVPQHEACHQKEHQIILGVQQAPQMQLGLRLEEVQLQSNLKVLHRPTKIR